MRKTTRTKAQRRSGVRSRDTVERETATPHQSPEWSPKDPAALMQRTAAFARAADEHIEARREQAKRLVEELLSLPRSKRWAKHSDDHSLAGLPVLFELLERAADRALDSETREDLALWVGHLVAAFGPTQGRVGLAVDSAATAAVFLAELAIERREIARAQLQLALAKSFCSVGTGDPLLLAEVDLHRAFLGWARGRWSGALSLLRGVCAVAKELGDPVLEAQASLFRAKLYQQIGREPEAQKARASAARVLSREGLAITETKVEEVARRLGLKCSAP